MENQQPNQYQAPAYAQNPPVAPQQVAPQPQPTAPQPTAPQPQQAYVQPTPAYVQPATAKPKKGWGKLILALVLVPLFIVGELVGMLIADALNLDDVGLNLMAEACGAISMLIPCLVLGGTKLLNITKESWKIGWHGLWWSIAISAGIAIYDLYWTISEGELNLVPDWPWQLFLSLIFCIFIGFFEEFMTRGLVLNGLLARMGTNRKGVVWACILSAVFFGMLHVDLSRIGDITFLEFAQGILKVLQTGMYGFALAAVVCKTGELVSASLLHCLDDWLLFMLTFVMGESLETEYVASGTEEGIATVVVYLVCIALYIPLVIRAVKTLKTLDIPNRGAFFREAAAAAQPAPAAPTGYAAPAFAPQAAAPTAPAAPVAPQGYPVQQRQQAAPAAPQGYPTQQAAAPTQQPYVPPFVPVPPQQPAPPANLIPTEIPESSLFRTGQSDVPPAPTPQDPQTGR